MIFSQQTVEDWKKKGKVEEKRRKTGECIGKQNFNILMTNVSLLS